MIKFEKGTIDRYTVAHGMIGGVLGIWGAPWTVALGTSLLFEFVEDRIKLIAPDIFPDAKPDSRHNSIADTVAFMAGWALSQKIPGADPAKIWKRLRGK